MPVTPAFNSDGLSSKTAASRLATAGLNEVAEHPFSFPRAIFSRLWEPSAWILEAALILEIVLGKWLQAGFILLMLLFAALDGAIQSRRATTVLQTLAHQLTATVTVKRDGHWQQLSARKLVVGDLISLNQGDLVPADAILLTQSI